jgi:hypothetical protein
VKSPIRVESATWTAAGDYWVGDRCEWWGRVSDPDGHPVWIRAADCDSRANAACLILPLFEKAGDSRQALFHGSTEPATKKRHDELDRSSGARFDRQPQPGSGPALLRYQFGPLAEQEGPRTPRSTTRSESARTQSRSLFRPPGGHPAGARRGPSCPPVPPRAMSVSSPTDPGPIWGDFESDEPRRNQKQSPAGAAQSSRPSQRSRGTSLNAGVMRPCLSMTD